MEFQLSYFLLLHLTVTVFGQAHRVKICQRQLNSTPYCKILEEAFIPDYEGLADSDGVKIKSCPATARPTREVKQFNSANLHELAKILEIYGETENILEETLDSLCPLQRYPDELAYSAGAQKHLLKQWAGFREGPEVRPLVYSGDPSNRVDLVFMGDGYTASEREKFFQDGNRFVQYLFEGVALRSFLPLFNVWAIFVESRESGIGQGEPRDTPFKLYRDDRAFCYIHPGNAGYVQEVCALTGEEACDVPCLLANDDYCGGWGGEGAIFTRSPHTGKEGMFHELGHAVLRAGEEYDNGYRAYFGVNSVKSVNNVKNITDIAWSHWLSGDINSTMVERAMRRILEDPWKNLTEGPLTFPFLSDGIYDRWQLRVSVMGAEREDSVEFFMDGQPLPWKSKGHPDRAFYDWIGEEGFSEGRHSFTVRSHRRETPKGGNEGRTPMICQVALRELGEEEEYHLDNDYVSAYPTWDVLWRKTFRPTNAGCLMGNLTHDRFCPVCQEGLWLRFLAQVELIEDLIMADCGEPEGFRRVLVKTLPLGQFRPGYLEKGEEDFVEIKWLKGDEEQEELRNKREIRVSGEGLWTVQVRYVTPQVRYDPRGILNRTHTFIVGVGSGGVVVFRSKFYFMVVLGSVYYKVVYYLHN